MSKKQSKLTASLKEKVRNLYVQGIDDDNGDRILFSLDELAQKHDIAKSTLYRHAKNENWKMSQERFQQDYLTELDSKRKTELVKESKKFDTTTLNISKALLGQIGTMIKRSQQEDKFTPSMVNQLCEATYKVQKVAKLALGEATENMNLNANVKDTTAFNEAMELLDEIGRAKRTGDLDSIH